MARRRIGPLALAATVLGCSATVGYRPTPAAHVPGRDYEADLAACRAEADRIAAERDRERWKQQLPGLLLANILTGAIPQALTGVGVYWTRAADLGEGIREARACLIRKGWALAEDQAATWGDAAP